MLQEIGLGLRGKGQNVVTHFGQGQGFEIILWEGLKSDIFCVTYFMDDPFARNLDQIEIEVCDIIYGNRWRGDYHHSLRSYSLRLKKLRIRSVNFDRKQSMNS